MAGKHQNIIQGHSNPSRPCSETIRNEVQDATNSGLPEKYVEYQGPRLTRERAKYGGGDWGECNLVLRKLMMMSSWRSLRSRLAYGCRSLLPLFASLAPMLGEKTRLG